MFPLPTTLCAFFFIATRHHQPFLPSSTRAELRWRDCIACPYTDIWCLVCYIWHPDHLSRPTAGSSRDFLLLVRVPFFCILLCRWPASRRLRKRSRSWETYRRPHRGAPATWRRPSTSPHGRRWPGSRRQAASDKML